MIGLIALLIAGGLLVLAIWAFIWTYRAKRRQGKSDAVSIVWAVGAVLVLSLPITWDAIPTWIAFEYYAHKNAEFKVFKTLEQWKAENPGAAETLEPYSKKYGDPREKSFKLANGKMRSPLNARFSKDQENVDLFLTVREVRQDIVDTNSDQSMARWTTVDAGYGGGLYSGGEGWWKFWLNHRTASDVDRAKFDKLRDDFRLLGQ